MKKLLVSLLFLSGYIAHAQITPTVRPEPDWYIDSVKYVRMPYLDINKILGLDVKKDQSKNGAIYIKTKGPGFVNIVSLEKVARQQITDGTPYMVMVDNEFVKDVALTSIDSSFILRCEKISTKDFKQAQDMPAMIILKITTATKENVERANQIRLRGLAL